MDLVGKNYFGYEITDFISEGGMATVWRAVHPVLGRTMAVKVLAPMLSRDAELVERFVREAQLAVQLSHPNIVRVENFSREELAILMEFIEGDDLSNYIGQKVGPMPLERALPMMWQLLDAFGHAHEQGVIHRDIKPSNILVLPSGDIKVTDFGIAKMMNDANLTRTGASMGTAAYMSPEQIKGARDVDHRADIYSLGVTFYEMLAGRPPYVGKEGTDNDYLMREAHVRREPPDPRDFYPAIPGPMVDHLMVMLAKDPAQRFQSIGQIRSALKTLAGDGQGPAVAPVMPQQPLRPPPTVVETAPASAPPVMAMPEAVVQPAPVPLSTPQASKPPVALIAAIAGVLVVGGIIAAVLASGGKDESTSGEEQPAAGEAQVTSSSAAVAKPEVQKVQWVRLQGGSYKMGSTGWARDERPVHTVRVSGFELMKTPVTLGMYAACVNAGSCSPGGTGKAECNWGKSGRSDHPINCVDLYQAQRFCSWARGRLPSEAEWEYAARGGGGERIYPWGYEEPSCARTVMTEGGHGCGLGRTFPVCAKPAGNSPQGLCDLSGNVWEWVEDCWHRNYSGAPSGGEAWTTECTKEAHVVRGGCWNNKGDQLRVANRYWSPPGRPSTGLGIRCAR